MVQTQITISKPVRVNEVIGEMQQAMSGSGLGKKKSLPVDAFVGRVERWLIKQGEMKRPWHSLMYAEWARKRGDEPREYAIYDLMVSYPFILQGYARAAARPQQWLYDRDDRYDEDFIAAELHIEARALYQTVQASSPGQMKWPQLRKRPEDKVAFPSTIDLPSAVVAARGKKVIGDKTGERELTIAHARQRAVAGAAAGVLSAYVSTQLGGSVVGYRPGVSIPHALSAIRQAVHQTDRRVLLAIDIKGFFDDVPHAQALHAVRVATGLTGAGDEANPALLHIRNLLGWNTPQDLNKTGLPQGSPLSPVVSNIFGAQYIDPKLQQFGPMVRYADDICLVLDSVAEADEVVTEIDAYLMGYGLSINAKKVVIYDLDRGVEYRGPERVESVIQSPVLGVIPRLAEGRLWFDLGDQALWKLIRNFHDELRRPPIKMSVGVEDRWQHYFERLHLILQGWLQAYGGLDWDQEQARVFIAMLERFYLLPGQNIDPIPDRRLHGHETAELGHSTLADYLRHGASSSCREPDYDPTAEPWLRLASVVDVIKQARHQSGQDPIVERYAAVADALCDDVGPIDTFFEPYRRRFGRTMKRRYALEWGNPFTKQNTNPGGEFIGERGNVAAADLTKLPMATGRFIVDDSVPKSEAGKHTHGGTRLYHLIDDQDSDADNHGPEPDKD